MTLLNHDIKLGVVTIQVIDLDKMTSFYTVGLGLKLKSQSDTEVLLGTSDLDLLRLVSVDKTTYPMIPYTGLYHFALLLPEQNDLLAILYFLQKNHVEVSGAADHLFSEAIYLNDPEGNGIEIYVDRPRDEWVVEENGQLKGVSDPLDIEGMIHRFDHRVLTEMPNGTVMGHIHLSVANVSHSEEFYTQVLGMEVMTSMPHASFLAMAGYHHHIGMNSWTTLNAEVRPSNISGLMSYEIIVDNLEEIKINLAKLNLLFTEINSSVRIEDYDKIQIILKETL